MKDCASLEPRVLSANCYFWKSGSNASNRRRNEERHNTAADSFINSLNPEKYGLSVSFSYSESCNHVYKSFSVTRIADGSKANIKTFRKLYTIKGRRELKAEHEKRLAKKVKKVLITGSNV